MDYRGNYGVILVNPSWNSAVDISEGDRICQLILQKVETCEWEEVDNLEDLDKYIKNNMPEYLTLGGVKYNFDDVVNKISLDSKLSKTNTVSGVLDYIDKIGLVQGFNWEEFKKMFKENLTKTLSENKNSSSDMIKLEVEKAWENKIEEIKKSRELGKGVHLLIETLLSSIKNSPRLTDGMLNNIFNSVISKTNTKINEYNTKIANKELNPPIDGIVPSLEGFNETNLKDVLNQFINTIYNPLINNSNKVWIRTEQNLQEKLGEDFANNPEVSVNIDSIKGKLDILFIYENRDIPNKKVYIKTFSKQERDIVLEKIKTCDKYVEQKQVPPKTEDITACKYCDYKGQCRNDG